jgi:SHS2 domain-containing protein
MARSYRFLPDIALSDIAFEVRADSLEELLIGAAEASAAVMIDLDDLKADQRAPIELRADDDEDLLYKWLSELIYLKDINGVIYTQFSVTITQATTGYTLRGEARGQMVDSRTHKLGVDVKAVTYHMFKVWRREDAYCARVVLDI